MQQRPSKRIRPGTGGNSRRKAKRPGRGPWIAAGVIVAVGTAIALTVAFGVGQGGPRAGPVTVQPGSLAKGELPPDFTASTFDGNTLTLSSLRGKPVLINFFASWCTSCRAEMPSIEQAYQAHKAQGFTVVAVNTLENGDGVGFYREMRVTFPAVFDPGTPGKIGAAYRVTTGLPASVFLDRNGKVTRVQYGIVTRDFIERELQPLL